jgi:hypothetical protein
MIAGANQFGQPITLNGQTVGGSYIATAHGSTTAGPMWADAMRAIQDLLPNLDFVPPIKTTTSQTPDLAIVPNVVGMTQQDAQTTLQGLGFIATVVGQVPSELAPGLVVQTSPEAGSTMYNGSTVSLYISTGPAPPPVTNSPSPPGPTNTPPGHGHGHH